MCRGFTILYAPLTNYEKKSSLELRTVPGKIEMQNKEKSAPSPRETGAALFWLCLILGPGPYDGGHFGSQHIRKFFEGEPPKNAREKLFTRAIGLEDDLVQGKHFDT